MPWRHLPMHHCMLVVTVPGKLAGATQSLPNEEPNAVDKQ